MRFTKCHGAGNDFVVVDARNMELPWSDVAKRVCDRHYGVGSDGIILIMPSSSADLRMRMFNPDGSEAEACGNGLRCFVKYAFDRAITQKLTFTVETLGGIRNVAAFPDETGCVIEAELSMGAPRLEPAEIPVDLPDAAGPILEHPVDTAERTIPLSMVSMGNPHAVAFIDSEVADYPLHTIGPTLEHHPVFPARVNFEVAHVLGRGDISARVWERGAGETLACGSGACAIAVAARLLDRCDETVRIHLPGGILTITWPGGDAEVLLRGPVAEVFTGDWPY
jgi:diaminopimelate epimerase